MDTAAQRRVEVSSEAPKTFKVRVKVAKSPDHAIALIIGNGFRK